MMTTIEEIRQIAAFQQLSEEQHRLLASLMVRRHYAPGELIFLEGDPSKGIWFIVSGRVRIVKMSNNGRVQALCVVNPGKCFGGCPLFSMEKNPANAQALDEVTLLILPQTETEFLQATDPDLMRILLQIYSERLDLLARLSEGLGTRSVNARINEILLTYAVEDEQRLVVRFTHEKLAHLVGTVREVVTRHLVYLEGQHIIAQEHGMIEILDRDELQSTCIMGM